MVLLKNSTLSLFAAQKRSRRDASLPVLLRRRKEAYIVIVAMPTGLVLSSCGPNCLQTSAFSLSYCPSEPINACRL
ncbi:hypothetical protein SODALDRAFT_70022 [Sodiomyces alkalinus F11]|uniref:Uncharacterized protein n=1 Tax=Sodiomyces alkalinus (strain CBS 110278 / VKM F-3762 / F11) TaxID=1314773 RepID=A0A3N2PM30_SODAK|nr:hypothetical protein SODALDRAFT_70022 [Sodiomyces alkalinus F11]ROT35573.1 hypothetical protein SODALDRAFT_70022 [Sodiomyces alkalinus F11]